MFKKPLTKDERREFIDVVVNHFSSLRHNHTIRIITANIEQDFNTQEEFKKGAFQTSISNVCKVTITYECEIFGGL